jgi:hypothetical protein
MNDKITLADIVRLIVIAIAAAFFGAPVIMLAVRWWLTILQLAGNQLL